MDAYSRAEVTVGWIGGRRGLSARGSWLEVRMARVGIEREEYEEN